MESAQRRDSGESPERKTENKNKKIERNEVETKT